MEGAQVHFEACAARQQAFLQTHIHPSIAKGEAAGEFREFCRALDAWDICGPVDAGPAEHDDPAAASDPQPTAAAAEAAVDDDAPPPTSATEPGPPESSAAPPGVGPE